MIGLRCIIVTMSKNTTLTPGDLAEHGIPEWTLGWRLNRSLAAADVGHGEMADYLGVHRSTISRWIGDQGAPPKDGYIRMWAIRCGVDYEWLATGLVDLTRFGGDTGGQVIDASGWLSRTPRRVAKAS